MGTDNRSEAPPSGLYTFIDGRGEFALYFLEGQRLIQDLALLHPIRKSGFAYFRDVVLSIQPMIALLKHGAQLGFYIDSEEPYFKLKIETGHNGATRCMLLPEHFQEFPKAMHGLVRVHKLFADSAPYQSVLEISGLPLREIVNRVLEESYQVNSSVVVSETSDQSLLLHQLPALPGSDESESSRRALRNRWHDIEDPVEQIFALGLTKPDEIAEAFKQIGMKLLVRREISFQCGCSRPRMIQNVRSVYQTEGDSLFDPGQDTIDITCEYCKSHYRISRHEIDGPGDSIH
jgi:molecular chaperone Hsp33